MVDVTAIGVVAHSLNAAVNIAKAMIDVRDATAFQGKVFELQRAIIDAQQNVFAANDERSTLIEKISDLEKELSNLKTWETQKQRYELEELAPGVFAYRLKEAMAGSEPIHNLCAACYQHGKPSLLQRWDSGMNLILKCPECKTDFKIGNASFHLP